VSVRFALGLVLLSLAAETVSAATPEEIFERGNTAYEEGRFLDAAEAYRAVLRYRIRDAVVEFNLGNAEFRLGNLGPAILHYERARRLAPTDRDVLANLDYARSLCRDRVEAPPEIAIVGWLRDAQSAVGPDPQAWATLVLVWVACGLIAWCFARPGGWTAGHGWAIAALLLAITLGFASWRTTYARVEGRALAVVLAEASDVLAGPGENNATLFTVHEGLTLEVRSEREDWLQVSLPNGLNGWVRRGAVASV